MIYFVITFCFIKYVMDYIYDDCMQNRFIPFYIMLIIALIVKKNKCVNEVTGTPMFPARCTVFGVF